MQTTAMRLNAPASKAFRPKPRAASQAEGGGGAILPAEEDGEGRPRGAAATSSEPVEPANVPDKLPAEEEDEEVRVAMEMALAAAQNPHLSVSDLRKLVAGKSRRMSEQAEIVEQVQQKKELERLREREEQHKRWNDQKEKMVGFWKVRAGAVVSGVSEVKKAAERKAEELQDQYERRLYAEEIQNDSQVQEYRKRIRFLQKALKAHRLQGNREETRHSFKRQRQEKKLIQLYEKVEKTTRLFTASSYNVHEYAKAMMRASKKWNKKSSSDHELALEAQLCRNMHQMLAIEKQKSKVKKSTREMKKYLQRCKGWLSDKKALCEMHIMTLDATSSSMMIMYEDTLSRQDALIQRLISSEEFAGVDLASVELGPSWSELSMLQEYHNRSDMMLGPSATLAALRGLPINDSIRLRRTALEKEENKTAPSNASCPQEKNEFYAKVNGPQIFIETKDDASVSSHLSDPDEDRNDTRNLDSDQLPPDALGDSQSDIGFDRDAPWMARSTTENTSSIAEEEEDEPQSKFAEAIIGPSPMNGTPPGSQPSSPCPAAPADLVVGGREDSSEMDSKPAALKDPPPAQAEVATSDPSPAVPRNESPPSVVVTTEDLNGTEPTEDLNGMKSRAIAEKSLPTKLVDDADGELHSTPKSVGSKASVLSEDGCAKLAGEDFVPIPGLIDESLPESTAEEDSRQLYDRKTNPMYISDVSEPEDQDKGVESR